MILSEPRVVVVTGASGFVGGHLVRALEFAGQDVQSMPRDSLEQIAGDSGPNLGLLSGCASCVIHLAARAHVMTARSLSQIDIYRQANRDTTLKLARAAASAGIRRFVFVSSILVNGSSSCRPFRSQDVPQPGEPYAVSKLEAELGLWKIAEETNLEVVVVRAPLVYGQGVKGNFRRLLWLIASGIPLPLASIDGRRSLIGVRNLCDFLSVCLDHQAAPGRTLLVSDGEDSTLPELIRELAAGMGRSARLFPASPRILGALAAVWGRRSTFDKLTASLQVNASETFEALNWRPPVSLRDGLKETALWFQGLSVSNHGRVTLSNG